MSYLGLLKFAFLFAIIFFADIYPLNLLLVTIFSALIGWQIGPTIEHFGKRFKMKKYLKSHEIVIKKDRKLLISKKGI